MPTRSPFRFTNTLVVAIVAVLLGGHSAARAQMVTGEHMTHFADVFNVKVNQRTYPFTAVLIDTNIPANILWPDDQPTWTIQLQNNGADPIKGKGKIDVIQYGTRGEPGEIWVPTVFKIAEVAAVAIDVDLPGNGFQNVTISPKLPEAFGGYAVVADLGDAGRRFVISSVRTFKPTSQRIQYPSLSLDNTPGDTLPRLGIQAIRFGIGWDKPDANDYAKKMADLDAQLNDALKKNITVMLMVGASGAQPLGRPRPHLDDQDVMLETKSDMAWLPSEDDAFQAWVTEVASKYGWPKGPVTAIELWNEPWEGISISGWGADMLRFREIYKHMAQGVLKARQDANVQVLLAGCDSSSNTIDKLFPDDTDEFLPLLDVCTIHYQGMASPATYKKWLNRQGPNGRVKIWDTESWVANVDDRVAAVVATNKSVGYDRAMGVFGGNIWDHKDISVMAAGNKRSKATQDTAWSIAASVGAAVHFIGERPFSRLLFQNGLPWVMLFDGLPGADAKPNPDDGTIVVVGDIGEEFGKDCLLHRSIMGLKQLPELAAAKQALAALAVDAPADQRKAIQKQITALSTIRGATMVLDDGGGKFQLYDFYGNPQAGENGKITVPLDGRGFFLRANGTPGSFAALTNAVATSRIDGFECLEMIPHDLLAAVEDKPTVRVTCTNMFNRPITGQLTAKLGNLQIETPAPLSFQPNETRDIEIKVVGGTSVPENTYPLTLKFDAGNDGYSESTDKLHVNLIAHRTIAVDGKLDDWKGVLPQTIVSEGAAVPTMEEAAWFPFAKYDNSIKSGFATGYLAYDENNFYFAAKVADPDPDAGTLRFETRDDDQFYYPAVSYELDPATTFATKPGKIDADIRKPYGLRKPGADQERSYDTLESVVKTFKVKLSLPQDHLRRISLYFLDNDFYELGRRNIEVTITNPAGGKVLDKRQVTKFGQGVYAVYQLSGDLEITLRSTSFLNASLAGIFIDPVADAPAAQGPTAHFVMLDETTGGNWPGAYGKFGYDVIGTPAKLPDNIKLDIPQIMNKKEHDWPADVRRFSYRKRPILPAGDAPNFDNIQVAFNAISLENDPVTIPSPPGTPPKYAAYRDTDSQFALNKVADQYGGGTEIWRLDDPDHMRVHFFPRQPKAAWEGPVKDGQLVVTQDGGTRIVECAIPWGDIPDVKKLLDAGKPVKFSFRVNSHAGGGCMELARDRAVSRKNNHAFQVDWVEHWANELEFAFQK